MNRLYRRGAVFVAAAAIAGLCAVSGPAAQAQTANPFADPNKFCVKSSAPAGTRNSSSPGVTPDSILIGEGSTDTKALAAVGAVSTPTADIIQALVDEINSCGGINGRKLILKHINNNPLSPDPVGQLTALCLKATEDFKVFMMVGSTNVSPFPRCAAVAHKTIVQAASPGSYDTDDMIASKGRIFSHFPPNDQISASFVGYALKHSLFKGQKVMVLGVQYGAATTAQDLIKQYIAPLKAGGVDAYLEVVPCIGTSNCRAQVGAIVSRAKAAGVDSILLSHIMSSSTVGVLWKNMFEQNFKARLTGPANLTIHADSQQTGMVNEAGAAATRFISDTGATSFAPDESSLTGAWRIGYKESNYAKACIDIINKRLKNNPPWNYTEKWITSFYNGASTQCRNIRTVVRALWSLGNNVTTERAVAAIAKEPADKMQIGLPEFRTHAFYSAADPKVTKMALQRFVYPCPITVSVTPVACNIPSDRPIRARPF